MGLFSGIKKFVKKIGHGISKAFKTVRKAFSKIMSNKFVRFAMIAVSVFTMGATLAAGFANGGGILGALNAAGNMIVGKVTSLVTTPLKFVAKMAEGSGIGGLAEFGQALGETVQNFQDGADTLFKFGESASALTETVSAAADLTSADPSSLIDVAGETTMDAADFAAQKSAALNYSSVEPGFKENMLNDAATSGGAGDPWGMDRGLDVNPTKVVSGAVDKGLKAGDSGFLRDAVGKIPGADAVLGGLDYVAKGFDKQPTLVKMGLMQAAASAFAADDEDTGRSAREEFLFRNNMALENPLRGTVGGVKSNTSYRDRNKATQDRARQSRKDIREQERRARRDTVGSAAGFGVEPMVYTPIFSKGRG